MTTVPTVEVRVRAADGWTSFVVVLNRYERMPVVVGRFKHRASAEDVAAEIRGGLADAYHAGADEGGAR